MKVFPVVHINNPAEAVVQAELALDMGADGVYLINHQGRDKIGDVFSTYNDIRANRPNAFVGVNLLGLQSLQACMLVHQLHTDGRITSVPNGLWADNALNETHAGETITYKNSVGDMGHMRYLGGISFKYTSTYTENPTLAYQLASEAESRVDVITTSGAGTGFAPTTEKIAAMKDAALKSGKNLAVASGIDLQNIGQFKGMIDEVLVASSLETKPYSGVFDTDKLQAFIQAAHEL